MLERLLQSTMDDIAEELDLVEPGVNIAIAFSGIRATRLNGVAHLQVYQEQPGTAGGVEKVIVSRMAGPVERVKAALESAVAQLSPPAAVNSSEQAPGYARKH